MRKIINYYFKKIEITVNFNAKLITGRKIGWPRDRVRIPENTSGSRKNTDIDPAKNPIFTKQTI